MFPWNLFPFNKEMKNMMQQMKPEEIEKYVKDMLSKMLPQNMQGMVNPSDFLNKFHTGDSAAHASANPDQLQSSVFETHDHIFVRIPIIEEDWLKKMRLYHTSNQMIIEHIPNSNDKHTITLPALVKKKGATASHKDGMLEIKIPKSIDMQFSEIDVTDKS
ncbi:spore coat protein [Bacillus methanolicus]|uniref:Hsp20/alpha crystallin family protein n=1 Tax=Bacillus methanolicus TaxID=1471 RepID=UPI002380A8C6|nr:Hsp20/alpha crystallin family protein [Bacillus methanolicus]MDE3839241.1 spore coat protein [Bacillus methanolicus]